MKQKNQIEIDGNVAKVIINSQKHGRTEILIDATDAKMVSQYRWTLVKSGTLRATARICGKSCYMHHLIIGKPAPGMVVDHKNRNTLDNRRQNLRFCTHRENMLNRASRGTTLNRQTGKWMAYVRTRNFWTVYLGSYNTEEEAHRVAMDAKQKNFPDCPLFSDATKTTA